MKEKFNLDYFKNNPELLKDFPVANVEYVIKMILFMDRHSDSYSENSNPNIRNAKNIKVNFVDLLCKDNGFFEYRNIVLPEIMINFTIDFNNYVLSSYNVTGNEEDVKFMWYKEEEFFGDDGGCLVEI